LIILDSRITLLSNVRPPAVSSDREGGLSQELEAGTSPARPPRQVEAETLTRRPRGIAIPSSFRDTSVERIPSDLVDRARSRSRRAGAAVSV